MTNYSQMTDHDTPDDSVLSDPHLPGDHGEPEPTNRTQKRVAKTRRKLLKSALDLFSRVGFAATTIEEITENADLGKGTFYRHFASKEELQEELLIDSILHLEGSLLAGHKPRQSLKEALERIFEVHARFHSGRRAAYLLLVDRLLNLHARGELTGRLADQFNHYLVLLAGMVGPFLDPARDPQLDRSLASGICGMVFGVLSFRAIALPAEEWPKHLSSLRKSFVAGCQAMMPIPATTTVPSRKL